MVMKVISQMMNKKVFTTTATMFVLLAGILAMTTPANVVHAQQFHGKGQSHNGGHSMADIMADIVIGNRKSDGPMIIHGHDGKGDMITMDMITMDMDMDTNINTATIHGITDTNIYTAMVLVTTTTTTTTTTTINLPLIFHPVNIKQVF